MKFSPLTCGLTAAILGLAVAIPFAKQAKTAAVPVEVVQLTDENWDLYAPQGKEVDAIYGDIVLRNEYLIAVIAQPAVTRNANMTVKDVGGALIDFTTRDQPSDQLSAFYPGKRSYKYGKASVSGIDENGGQFHWEAPRDEGVFAKGKSVSVSVESQQTETRPQVNTTYRLASDNRFLEVETTYTNPGAASMTFELEDDARLDGGKEDMIRAPNGEAKFYWAYDRHWNQAYGLEVVSDERLTGNILMNSEARICSFSYKTADGKTSATLASGESLTITRRLWAASNLLQLVADNATDEEQKLFPVVRLVLEDSLGQPIGRALVEFYRSDKLYGSARTSPDGKLEARVRAGKYTVRVTSLGRRLDHDDLMISPSASKPDPVKLMIRDYQTGQVDAAVTDLKGNPIPCKVEFHSNSPTSLDFGPETAEFGVKNLRYTPNGKFTQQLPAGEYDVIVSHGPEFDIVEQRLVIEPGKTAKLAAKLNRSVDTTGWVSGDYHSHSSPSGDNTSSQLGRVLNLVCEHIEFAPCTEHNRIDTYVPVMERLGIQKFMATVSGMELTGQPLPLNHQNSFPLLRKPHTQDNGAPRPAENFEDQIERLALWDDRSEKLVQVNHPDLGWMFYDKNGDGEPDAGYERGVPYMDVMEIHPIDSALHLGPTRRILEGRPFHNTIFCWLQLLNQGYRIYGVVNTDAHYNFHGSGWLRNWVQSSTDDPAKIDFMEMVHASEQGRLVMSNGPFLEVWASEPGQKSKVTAGQDLTASGKRVSLKVKVQCPNWLDINRLYVLVNGRIDPKHDYSREKAPDIFRNGVVKFDETLEVELSRDAHLIVVAGNVGGNLAKVYGKEYGKEEPAALTNPIYVDIDGDGFQPSKDTLDHPLPVKFGAGK